MPALQMITVADIVQHIAQALRSSEAEPNTVVRKYLADRFRDTHLCITADIEETELHYLVGCGHGDTFYFRIRDCEHGKRLTKDLYRGIWDTHPELSSEYDDKIRTNLYLFIHIRHQKQMPVTFSLPASGRRPSPIV
jgi:hypothetical protein